MIIHYVRQVIALQLGGVTVVMYCICTMSLRLIDLVVQVFPIILVDILQHLQKIMLTFLAKSLKHERILQPYQ